MKAGIKNNVGGMIEKVMRDTDEMPPPHPDGGNTEGAREHMKRVHTIEGDDDDKKSVVHGGGRDESANSGPGSNGMVGGDMTDGTNDDVKTVVTEQDKDDHVNGLGNGGDGGAKGHVRRKGLRNVGGKNVKLGLKSKGKIPDFFIYLPNSRRHWTIWLRRMMVEQVEA